MKALVKYIAIALALSFTLAGTATAESSWTSWRNSPHSKMLPFKSEEAFRRYLAERAKRQEGRRAKNGYGAPMAAPAPTQESSADAAAPAKEQGTDDSITNTQEAGVDEGGIVKVRGDTLVILRRGRLFTVSTRNGELRPIDYIDAFPPGVNPSSDWYDEMLIAGDRVIVIGYSYGRGGTEINRFRLSADGRLRFEDAYHLKSNDYYSSRNYASRLIGTRLIVYSPLYVPANAEVSTEWMPAVRRWTGNPQAGFQRIVSARDIYIPRQWENPERASIDAIHTVTECDLLAPELRCRATSVLGPAGRTFYVSAHAVYVWVTDHGWWRPERERNQSMLYRLPLDGSAPSAVVVHGAPVDQFSFREDWEEGVLNVLVRSDGGGDAMWNPEFSSGDIALVRFPLRDFGDGTDVVEPGRYRELPRPAGNAYAFQNRFVGGYLLYGTGKSWGAPGNTNGGVVVANVRGRGVTRLPLGHGVDRIEAMGDDAVVIGADQRNLTFQAIELTQGWRPQLGDRYQLESASQGETRSHAFFFKPEASDGGDGTPGVLGLPVTRASRPGYRQLVEGSAAITFLRRENRRFLPLGELFSGDLRSNNDNCRASCVDWYGNARPIFLRGRTFALMGYEIVEGEVGPRTIREVRRTTFAPGGRD
ncbi:MAG: hypothetical protein HOP13_16075 [Alphaproteobacteria bacterium]|nr:hypothetical protein [Alphaproteobacteria bacterium]